MKATHVGVAKSDSRRTSEARSGAEIAGAAMKATHVGVAKTHHAGSPWRHQSRRNEGHARRRGEAPRR